MISFIAPLVIIKSNMLQELIPLLRQLISMLENGGPFVLSADTLNIIEGGDLNIYGPGRSQQHSSTQVTHTSTKQTSAGPATGEVKKTEMKLVQQAPSHGTFFCLFV